MVGGALVDAGAVACDLAGAAACEGGERAARVGCDPHVDHRDVVAARQADNCYGFAYNQLVANIRRNAVTKPEAAQRFAEIDQGEHEVAAILAEYGKKTQASVQQYQAAFNQEAQRMNTSPDQLLADAGPPPPPSGKPAPAPRPTKQVSQNTRQLAQGYSKLNQQVSEINEEQSTIVQTATDRRHNMASLGVEVPS